jgi:hypothetical protein
VKGIVCPKLCKGERLYKVIFSAAGGSITTNRGIIKNDTIIDIDPLTDYKLMVTVTADNGEKIEEEISLPICDPIIPNAPLVASQSICVGETIRPFVALAEPNTTIDWYSQPTGGTALATDTPNFTPIQAGTYYAQARIPVSGCVSFGRSPATLIIKKTLCISVTVRKVKI